jgi:hypothetical protein
LLLECRCSPECPQHSVGIEPGARQQCYSITRCVTGTLLGSERLGEPQPPMG